MKKFKWTVEIEVDEVWIADGFDMREGNKETGTEIHDAISYVLPFASPEEIKVKVKKAPDLNLINKSRNSTCCSIKNK